MNKYKNIGIIACDLRQVHMAKYLMNKGYSINIICSEKLSHNKEYKENPDKFKGNVGDVCEILRVIITGRRTISCC